MTKDLNTDIEFLYTLQQMSTMIVPELLFEISL